MAPVLIRFSFSNCNKRQLSEVKLHVEKIQYKIKLYVESTEKPVQIIVDNAYSLEILQLLFTL